MSSFPWDIREEIEPEPFHRPDTNIFFRISNRLLPPAPPSHVVLNYGDLKRLFRLRHYLLGVPMLVMFIGLILLQTSLWSGLRHSPLSLAMLGIGWLWQTLGWSALLLLIPAYAGRQGWSQYQRKSQLTRARNTISINSIGILNTMAVLEEQWFREGAENWNRRQRFLSCFSFGFVHMANLFYSFATILPLSLGGYLFMRVYLHEFKKTKSRKDAILAAALVHRVYNRVALLTAFVSLAYILLQSVLPLPELVF